MQLHIKALNQIAERLCEISGYDRSLLHEGNAGRRPADMKTWLTMLARAEKFSYEEIAEFLGITPDGAYKYLPRHHKRLEQGDYNMKWNIIEDEYDPV